MEQDMAKRFSPELNSTPLTKFQQQLVEEVIPWTWKRAGQYAIRMITIRPWLDFDELVSDLASAGFEGAVKAAQRFDPGRGFKFSTYVDSYLYSAMQNQERQRNSIGPSFANSKSGGGRPPKTVKPSCRIDTSEFSENGVNPADHRPVAELSEFEELIKKLSKRQKEILRLYCINGLNRQEIGIKMGISRERARQLINKALTKARKIKIVNEYASATGK
jgi:RNA polymerase sigma factor (sigma-70 family)